MALGIPIRGNEPTSSQLTQQTSKLGVTKPRRSTTSNSSNAGDGFVAITPETRASCFMVCVAGLEKCGKNHVAYTAPGPIFCQSLDTGSKDTAYKYIEGGPFWDGERTISVAKYAVEISGDYDYTEAESQSMLKMVAEAACPVWDRWVTEYEYALNNARTVVWDTESEAWELLRLARFGVLTPKTGRDRGNVWGPVNAEYRRLIRLASEKNVNFIMLQKLKDEYANDKKTGKKERKGFGDTGYMAQVVCWAKRVGGDFHLEITDCRQEPSMNGTELEDNHWDLLKTSVFGS